MAAIVYDDAAEPLIIMSKPVDAPEPLIPSVFVSKQTGVVIKRMMREGETIVSLTAASPPSPPPPQLPRARSSVAVSPDDIVRKVMRGYAAN